MERLLVWAWAGCLIGSMVALSLPAHVRAQRLERDEGWVFELSTGAVLTLNKGAYSQRLREFEFEEQLRVLELFRVSASAGRRLHPHLLLGASYFNLGERDYLRDVEFTQHFGWFAHALGLFVQGDAGFGRRRLLNVFGRLGLGASAAFTRFDAVIPSAADTDPKPIRTHVINQSYLRACGWLSAGVQLMPSRYVGAQFEVRYVLAPGIDNEIGETQELGGLMVLLGVRLRSWE